MRLLDDDIVVIAQKIVSKSEGQKVLLADVKVSKRAKRMAALHSKDCRILELIIKESSEIIAAKNGIIITETHHGFVCANAGVDQSNVENESALLLPKDPDRSARTLRTELKTRYGVNIAVIITDTFGRPFRLGQTNVAIGVSGISPIKSYVGSKDMFGKTLKVTEIAVADEIASAAELVMGKLEGIPFAIIRGYHYIHSPKSSAKALLRPKQDDLFR